MLEHVLADLVCVSLPVTRGLASVSIAQESYSELYTESASAETAYNGLRLRTSIQARSRVLADFCVQPRMMVSCSFITFCAIALSLPGVNGARTTVESHPKFVPLQPASPGSSIELTLGLPPSNVEGLHAALLDVSDPSSHNYGKYLSKSEVRGLFLTT